jgi:tetratricopeptide (TPR) repeat protein
VDIVLAFRDPDPRVGVALREWSQEAPDSWAALAARAQYWRGVAWRQRGQDTAARTSNERLRAFELNQARAATLLRQALRRKPTSIGAATGLVWALMPLGDAAATERAYRSAIGACPSCARPRYAYFRSRLPRWGGSVQALERIVAEAQAEGARSPRLANFDVVLRAHRCRIYLEREDELSDNADCADAARRGFYGILLKHAARLAGKRGDLAGADALTTRALSLSNEAYETRRFAITLSLLRGRAEDAAARLLRTRRLDPTAMDLNPLARDTGDGLVTRAEQLVAAGDRPRARTLLEEATWLDTQMSTESARADTITAGLDTSPAGLETLRVALTAAPDSFEAAQDLDYALSPQESWDQILPIWNRYLEAHPRDARAYRERSGTLHAMGRQLDALADLDRACALGMQRSCTTARTVHREQRDRATLRGD